MLKRLLALLEAGDTWSISDLAAALGTSPAMIQAMLSHLAQSGNLDIPDRFCTGTCAGCFLAGACSTGSAHPMLAYVSRTPKPHT